MFESLSGDQTGQNPEESFELLRELESNTPDAIRKARSSERIEIKSALIVQHGNTSELKSMKLQGTTGDISSGGCQALFPLPLTVGDVYRLTFDKNVINLPVTFARCVRCRLVRENAFESGLTFFTPIEMNALLKKPGTQGSQAA